MNAAYAIIILWIPTTVGLFAVLRPVRALTLAYLVGWLLLPMAKIPIVGFLDIDKVLATNIGALLGMMLFRSRYLTRWRWIAPDGWLLLFCAASLIASVTNGLGVYDGVSSAARRFLFFGAPYVLGRMFVRTREDLYEVGRLVVLGAAGYALLAVWEWRMSPHLHIYLYGFLQHGWRQLPRMGFWRPIVFFPHPLALGVFFVWTALLAMAMHRAKQLRPVLSMPPTGLVVLTLAGLATSMSFGPWGLFLIGFTMLGLCLRYRWKWAAIAPVILATFWMAARYTGLSDGQWLVSAATVISEERADSLLYRINAETLLVERAKDRPVFGWGGWGRNRVRDDSGKDIVYTDGLWVLLLGGSGFLGLVSFYLWWCWPVIASVSRGSVFLRDPVVAACVVAIGLQAVNLLFNGFVSPVLILVCGGVVGLVYRSRWERQEDPRLVRRVRFAPPRSFRPRESSP